MDALKAGWFSEISEEFWPGQSFSLEIDQVLYDKRSPYQNVQVFRSKTYGNVLVLDGIIQCTERDEFSYQEMMAHIPLTSHANPTNVLIIGGGDGGVLREVLKHKCVQRVVQCEIDEMVVEASKQFLPTMSSGFNDPRVTLHFGDGMEFLSSHEKEFDIIITDSSDPKGPGAALFEQSFFSLMKKSLRPDGIICTQGECLWLHLDLIAKVLQFSSTLFPIVSYAFTTIPTYPSGQIGFVLCSTNKATRFEQPVRAFTDEEMEECQLKYYNPDVHRAAFVLPQFAKQALAPFVTRQPGADSS